MSPTYGITIRDFHTYALRCPEGNPLFQALVLYRTRPYKVVESCTRPGHLTSHICSYPLQASLEAVEECLDAALASIGLHSHLTTNDDRLYQDLAKQAEEYLLYLPGKYQLSKAHKLDYRHALQQCHLTSDQRQALSQHASGHPAPWQGLKSYERLLRQKDQVAQKETRRKQAAHNKRWDPFPYELEDLQQARELELSTGFKMELRETSMCGSHLPFALLSERWDIKSRSLHAFLAARAILLQDPPHPVHVPQQLELHMRWAPARRNRMCDERKPGPGPGSQVYEWEYPTPYLWDTPDAHRWVEEHPDRLPSNWDELPAELQFDPDTPEQYR